MGRAQRAVVPLGNDDYLCRSVCGVTWALSLEIPQAGYVDRALEIRDCAQAS